MKRIPARTFAYLLTVLLTGLAVPAGAFAQLVHPGSSLEGLRGAPLIYKYDARSAALAGANSAEAGGLASMNVNPASLAFVRNSRSVQINMHQNWTNNVMLQNFTLPAFEHYEHRLALQAGYHHSGPQATNLLGSSPYPTPDLAMYQTDFVYAWSYDNILSVGIFNNVSFARNEYAQFWTYFANVGMLYAPSESISYGLTFRGLGRSITYEILESGRTILGSQGLRQSLELGTTLHFPVDSDHRSMSLSIANEKRFGESGMWYKGGLELVPWASLALRSGMLFHPGDRLAIPRFGFGLIQGGLRLDYTIAWRNLENEQFHQLGLTIQL